MDFLVLSQNFVVQLVQSFFFTCTVGSIFSVVFLLDYKVGQRVSIILSSWIISVTLTAILSSALELNSMYISLIGFGIGMFGLAIGAAAVRLIRSLNWGTIKDLRGGGS